MGNAGAEIFLIFVLFLANGLFAMSELAVLSARKVRLLQRADDGDSGARRALQLAAAPDRFLSTVQIGITLIGTLTGAVGGAALSEPMADWLETIPALKPYASGLSVFIVVVVITYFSLVIGELVPKRLALSNTEVIASRVAGFMDILSRFTAPLVSFLTFSTNLVLRVLRVQTSDEPPVTAEEIRSLMEQGEEVGEFEEAETDMVEGVFRLGERRVDALMTPRTEIEWLDMNDPIEDNLRYVVEIARGYFPVGDGSLDEVIGILNARDLLARVYSGQSFELRDLLYTPLFVPESMPALRALEVFKSSGSNIALVIDEYGGLLGMVTLFDVLQAIVGEISQSGKPGESQAFQREDGSWLVDGLMQIDEFKDLFDLDDLPDEERVGYQTVGGFVMSQLGSIPTPGQRLEYQNWRMEVLDMDGLRVDKVLVSKVNGAG